MSFNKTTAGSILKQYVRTKLKDSAEREHPGLAMVPKDPNAGGLLVRQPIKYRHTSNAGHNAAKVFGRDSASGHKDFQIPLENLYGRAVIAGYIMDAAEGKDKAWADMKWEMKSGMEDAGNTLSRALWGDGSGKIGRILSGVATATVTLYNDGSIFNFEEGMIVDLHDTLTGTTVRALAGATELTVVSVDWDSNQVTFNGAPDTLVTGGADDDYIFVSGDKGLAPKGIAAFIPDTKPDSTPFLGVNREPSPRLYGLRRDCTGKAIDVALEEGVGQLGRFSKRATHVFMNPDRMTELSKALGNAKEYANSDKKGIIGFDAFEVRASGQRLEVWGDSDIPIDRVYCLNLMAWKLYSTNKIPRVLDHDGVFQRIQGEDNYEVRLGGYVGLGCEDPGANIVLKF